MQDNILPFIDFEQSEVIGRKIADVNYVIEESRFDFNSPKSYDDLAELTVLNSTFKLLELRADVDLGEVKLHLKIEGSSKPIDASMMQMYIKREYFDFENKPVVKWVNITPKTEKGNMPFSVYVNDSQTFTFDEKLAIGKYTAARVIFFADGFKLLADQMAKVTAFEIVTTQIRVKKPFIEIHEDKILCPDLNNKIIIPFTIKFPSDSKPPYNAWWAMAKGSGGLFQQKWLAFGKNVNGTVQRTDICKEADGPDKYWYVESFFQFDLPDIVGLYNIQYGIFDNNWKESYHWIWPGTDLEVGGEAWVAKCPVEKLPPRLRVKDGRFIKLDGLPYNFYEGTKGADAISAVRGASWGNSYGWTRTPAFNRSGYFSSLRFLGHRICRFLFDPDQYTTSKVYRNRILDSINKILIGGMYPLVGPHNLHVNVSGPAERDKKFLEMCEMIASDWKGLPIMYAIASEPKELTGGWPECKALWEKAAKLVRDIDPDMFIIVPTAGYSKTSTLPESKDLLDKNLVDAYSYHPYNKAIDVIPFMKPLLDSGVGIIVEEYGCGNVTWQKAINIEMQKISKQYPNLLAFLTWAWTKQGQDACPMVENGDLANITLTESGKMQALDIAVWDSGNFIDESGNITPPSVDDEGNIETGGTTTEGNNVTPPPNLNNYYDKTQIDNLITTKIDLASKTFDDKQNILNEKIVNLTNKIDENNKALLDKIETISNNFSIQIPFSQIQDYLSKLSNCQLLSVQAVPSSVVRNSTSVLTIRLTSPAPQGGVVIYLNSSLNQILVPNQISINENEMQTNVVVNTLHVTAATTGRISATFNGKTIFTNMTVKTR